MEISASEIPAATTENPPSTHDRHRLKRDQDTDHGAEQSNERSGCTRSGEHPDVAVEFDGLLKAALLVELDQMIAIEGLCGRDQHMIDALGRIGAGLSGLQRLVELALP